MAITLEQAKRLEFDFYSIPTMTEQQKNAQALRLDGLKLTALHGGLSDYISMGSGERGNIYAVIGKRSYDWITVSSASRLYRLMGEWYRCTE